MDGLGVGHWLIRAAILVVGAIALSLVAAQFPWSAIDHPPQTGQTATPVNLLDGSFTTASAVGRQESQVQQWEDSIVCTIGSTIFQSSRQVGSRARAED
jgi:hypothetical protein